jgi:hypothetical protein
MHTPDNSFLLRLWQVPDEERQGCRVLLENIRTGEKLGFVSLDDLIIYLKQVMAQESNKPDRVNHSGTQG